MRRECSTSEAGRSGIVTDQQVILQIPGDRWDVTSQEHVYHVDDDVTLTMDIYRPASSAAGEPLPVLIFVFGFADSVMLERQSYRLKDSGQYLSWSRLATASGHAAIIYETEQPEKDILRLIDYVRQNANDLQVDADRIGFLAEAVSRNLPVTFVNYASGEHGFDVRDDSLQSREIIKQTLEFVREHLSKNEASVSD